jgi:hypothetical protein
MILPTAYFPNIQSLSKFYLYEDILIEAFEHYEKKSYRNRCDILAANGKMSLSVPIIKPKTIKALTKDVEIDYKTDWQKQHLKSIESAYNSSPFYEYIMPDFLFVFEQKEKFLLDLNNKILDVILGYLPLASNYTYTSEYTLIESKEDYRKILHPKVALQKLDSFYKTHSYYQTFSEKFDFIENLSVLDLLFNEGPRSEAILRQSSLLEKSK